MEAEVEYGMQRADQDKTEVPETGGRVFSFERMPTNQNILPQTWLSPGGLSLAPTG